MKHLLCIALCILLPACATNPGLSLAEEEACPVSGLNFGPSKELREQRECVARLRAKQELDAKIAADPDYLKKEAARLAEVERQKALFEKAFWQSEEAGTPLAEFLKYHRAPDQEELRDGKKVLWYDVQGTPVFFVFESGRLVSKIIDRDAIERREAAAERRAESARRQAADAEQQRTNRMLIWQSMQRSQPKQTNCTSYRVGNTVQTNCN